MLPLLEARVAAWRISASSSGATASGRYLRMLRCAAIWAMVSMDGGPPFGRRGD